MSIKDRRKALGLSRAQLVRLRLRRPETTPADRARDTTDAGCEHRLSETLTALENGAAATRLERRGRRRDRRRGRGHVDGGRRATRTSHEIPWTRTRSVPGPGHRGAEGRRQRPRVGAHRHRQDHHRRLDGRAVHRRRRRGHLHRARSRRCRTRSSGTTPRLYGEERVGLVTGDLVIRRDAPCRVMTTEVLRNMLLSGEKLPNLRAVVLDEIHFLDDRERGTVWEEVLIYLPKHVQVVGSVGDPVEPRGLSRTGWSSSASEPSPPSPRTSARSPCSSTTRPSTPASCDPKEYEKRWKRKAGKVLGTDDADGGRGRDQRARGRGGRNRGGAITRWRPARRATNRATRPLPHGRRSRDAPVPLLRVLATRHRGLRTHASATRSTA